MMTVIALPVLLYKPAKKCIYFCYLFSDYKLIISGERMCTILVNRLED